MSVVQVASISNGKLAIDTLAFGQILDKVGTRPVAIVSVNGPMRSGKSYILNHFLRYLSDPGQDGDWFRKPLPQQFHWKNSSERQTTGILAWSEPLAIDGGGQEVAVLLLDTQGCFDDQTTTVENSLIFAFSCLLSSILIYNFKNQLSEDLLQFLQMFVGYAKAIINEESPESFSKLVFAIRDWQCPGDYAFGYYDDANSPSPRNFKREKLDVRPEMVAEVRVVHQEIVSSFRNVGCCLMPYPGSDLAYYDKADNVDSLFVKSVQDFVPRIFEGPNLITKKIAGQQVTGPELKKLIEKWAQLFADAEVPAVQNVAEATASVQNAIAADVALKFYQGEMDVVKQKEGLPQEEFQQLHQAKHGEAIAIYGRMKRLKNDAIRQKYLEQLTADLQATYESLQAINAALRQFREHKAASEQEMRVLREEMHRKIAALQRRGSSGGCSVM